MGNLPAQANLIVKDASSVAPPGEHLALLGDPRAGGIDQIAEGELQPLRLLLGAQDLLNRPGPPGAGLDGGVVGNHTDPATMDRADPGDNPVRAHLVRRGGVGEQAILEEGGGRIKEESEALAHRQLVLIRETAAVPLRTTLVGARLAPPQLLPTTRSRRRRLGPGRLRRGAHLEAEYIRPSRADPQSGDV